MKINSVGLLVEMDAIPFQVGTVLNAQFQFDDRLLVTEKIRSIKHYDGFYRNPPKKKKIDDDKPAPAPKKLCEFHFVKVLDTTKIAIQKYLIMQKTLFKAEKKK